MEEKTIESGRLEVRRTNKLKPEVAWSVFNVTAYNRSSTDPPTYSDNKGTVSISLL